MGEDIVVKRLPDFLRVCRGCYGAGYYKQTYTAGCGAGYYEADGPCSYCKREEMFVGPGFVYQNGNPVPDSVIAQVLTFNDICIPPRDWTIKRQVAFPPPKRMIIEDRMRK